MLWSLWELGVKCSGLMIWAEGTGHDQLQRAGRDASDGGGQRT